MIIFKLGEKMHDTNGTKLRYFDAFPSVAERRQRSDMTMTGQTSATCISKIC